MSPKCTGSSTEIVTFSVYTTIIQCDNFGGRSCKYCLLFSFYQKTKMLVCKLCPLWMLCTSFCRIIKSLAFCALFWSSHTGQKGDLYSPIVFFSWNGKFFSDGLLKLIIFLFISMISRKILTGIDDNILAQCDARAILDRILD